MKDEAQACNETESVERRKRRVKLLLEHFEAKEELPDGRRVTAYAHDEPAWTFAFSDGTDEYLKAPGALGKLDPLQVATLALDKAIRERDAAREALTLAEESAKLAVWTDRRKRPDSAAELSRLIGENGALRNESDYLRASRDAWQKAFWPVAIVGVSCGAMLGFVLRGFL